MIANKYEIIKKIGQGTLGSVFLGEVRNRNRIEEETKKEETETKKTESRKKVAIKIEKEGSLRNEARILEFLARNGCGKNIVQLFWYGVQDNYFIMVMTYIDGISLSNTNMTMNMDIQEKTKWFIASVQLLEKIHSVGVIHRDIKPAHFIFWNEKWYLIDFGFSTFASASALSSNPVREYIIGTPNYISISIHNGFSPTARDDLISLVYIFSELCEKERLPWTRTVFFSSEEMEKYPSCHILHVQNQYKRKYKEKWDSDYLQEINNNTNTINNVYTRLINMATNNINIFT